MDFMESDDDELIRLPSSSPCIETLLSTPTTPFKIVVTKVLPLANVLGV